MSGSPDYTTDVSIIGYTITSLPIDIVAQTIGNLSVDVAAQSVGDISIDIAGQSVGDLTVDIAAQSLGNLAVDIAAQSVGNLGVDIAAQTVGNLSIDIAAQSIGNVGVSIDAQTVDIDIKTSGGANIVIDKLTQTAYAERRDTLSNNGATASWADVTGNNRRGKLFPRGCRGFINTIDVYCRDAAAAGGTITVYIAPLIGMGALYSATVTVPASGAADWRSATFNKPWIYDSLFVWVLCSVAAVDFAYDSGTPYDDYSSTDSGASWTHGDNRLWLRIIQKGLTAGDLPVAGTLNTIQIPNTLSKLEYDGQNNVDGQTTWTFQDTVYGAGRVLGVMVQYNTVAGTVDANDMYLDITADGTTFSIRCGQLESFLQTPDPTTTSSSHVAPLSITKYDTTNDEYAFCVNVQVPFKFSIKLEMRNNAAAGNKAYCRAIWIIELLS